MQRRRILLAGLAFTLALSACHAQENYKAEAEHLTELLHWQPGSVVADIGAGDGELTLLAAERAGPAGRVYATEVDPKKLEHLEELAAKNRNVTAVKGASDSTNLPPACCDSIVVRRVYHHFPKPPAMDASLWQSLKPGGLLAIIDFAPREGLPTVKEDVPKNRNGHGIAPEIVIEEMTAAGFELASRPDHWPSDDYCLIFRKAP